MSVREILESARFPKHQSGGYQMVAVDSLLTKAAEQAAILENQLSSVTGNERALLATVESLESQLEETRDSAADMVVVVETLTGEPELSPVERDNFLTELFVLREQAASDEEHIASLEKYADEMQAVSDKLRAEIVKIRSDAESVIRSLLERIATHS